MFNPKLKEFTEKNPDQTILGFAWSLWWRLTLVIYGIVFGVALLIGLFAGF